MALALILSTPLSAVANPIIYDWSGACSGTAACTGTSSGVLTLAGGFTPGAVSTDATDFISFVYTWFDGTDVYSFSDPSWFFTFDSGNGALILDDGASQFTSFAGGNWGFSNTVTDNGTGGIFSLRSTGTDVASPDAAVPEPGTLALLAFGLAGLVFGRRRKNG